LNQDEESSEEARSLVTKWMSHYRRGTLRFFVLHLLLSTTKEQEEFNHKKHHKYHCFHGYKIPKLIDLLTNGKWKPTTASIYPILHDFEKRGLIEEIHELDTDTISEDSKKKRKVRNFVLTSFGRDVALKLEMERTEFMETFPLFHKRRGPGPMFRLLFTLSEEELKEVFMKMDHEKLKERQVQLEEHNKRSLHVIKQIEDYLENS
jgi:DNA-binding PadR family transcriptional regulator